MLIARFCFVLAALLQTQDSGIAPDQSTPSRTDQPAVTTPQATPALAQPATPSDEAGPTSLQMAEWLVDLARHEGHLLGRSKPRSAALHLVALLQAARDIAPDCADASYWLYDLMFRMNKTDSAREALATYVRLSPEDVTARVRDLEIKLDAMQTSEERSEYVKNELRNDRLPRAYESELRRRMARFYFERRDAENASREVEQALRLNPMNVPARELAYEMFGETEPALQRVEMALQLIAINPSQANLIWDLGEFLDRLSMHRQAQEWYNRAIEVHHRSESQAVPATFWHKLAVSYLRSGDYAEAAQAAASALKVDPSLRVARLLRAQALEKLGKEDEADQERAAIAKAYGERVDIVIKEKLTDEAPELAWFYCYHQPEKDRALALAKIAMMPNSPTLLAKLAYGYALRLNGRSDEAMQVLKPLVTEDQLAAVAVADMLIDKGEKGPAISILHKAAMLQYSGIGFNIIRERLERFNENVPEPPVNAKVVRALDKFHRDVFSYHEQPSRFLTFSMRFAEKELNQVGSVRVTFRLENIGPFPITFGEGFMARSLVAVSARIGGQNGTAYPQYLQVLMNAKPVLLPGDAIEKTVDVNVGAMRNQLIRSVTKAEEIEITAMLDPVFENGELVAGMGTIKAGPIIAMRPAISVQPAAVAALLERSTSPSVSERINAAIEMGALLAEAQYGAVETPARRLPVDSMSTALASLLTDHDWRVRARAMEAVSWFELTGRTTNAAAQAIRKEDSEIVKMLAVSLFAEQHGEKFRAVLEQLSKNDPSASVRIMAQSYLPASDAQVSQTTSMQDSDVP